MIAIRLAQTDKLSEVALKSFEDMMVVHLNKFFPGHCGAAGEPKVRELIRHGVKRAASYQITAKRDVSRYIDLMIVLGDDFDCAKPFPWAQEILRTRNSPEIRISVLLKTAQKHLGGA
jgi:hypothetical protein